LPVAPYIDLFRENFAYSMKYGWDGVHGGFWYTGWFRQPANGLSKSWWVQSEAMVSALMMYKLTRDPQYYEVFEKTWQFIDKYHVDRKTGEWWESVDAQLKQSGNKAHAWKAGYHNGRAMIEAINLIRSIGASQ
jgi:mannobiose 2-epimerase